MITLQAEPPLEADILLFPSLRRFSAPPGHASRAGAAVLLPGDDPGLADHFSVFRDWDDPVLVPSFLVGLSLALAQASMLWPVLRPV